MGKGSKERADYWEEALSAMKPEEVMIKPENMKGIRDEYDYMTMEEVKKPIWKPYLDACTCEEITIKGAGGQDMMF